MQLEIITIGDEILIGQILDSNSKWIAEELNKIGVSVYQITSIQDNRAHILSAIENAYKHSDIVILTGGLGPTKDDITKRVLAEYFNDELILNEEIVEHIKKMFKKMNYPFSEANRRQGLVPSKCTPLKNELGTAPGMWFNQNNKVLVSLPGVPYEMKALIKNQVIPKIQQTFKLPYILHKTILTYGYGESVLAEKIESWEDNLPNNIKLAYLPSFGNVRLRLSVTGLIKEEIDTAVEKQIAKLFKIIPNNIIGFDNEAIEIIVGNLLKDKKMTVSTAESCTGGNIAKILTAIPGASNYFIGSVVAYNARIKTLELNVSQEIIEKHSVVSAQVAKAMALGIQQKYKTNYAIATTGNAGPTTDNTDKTVGVVYIAIASPRGVKVEEFSFGKPREKVIQRASIKALEILRKEILKN